MHHDKIFRLAGAYRHLVTVAKNVRLAPVRTSKDNTPVIRGTESQAYETNGEVDDVIYDEWSYNRENEKNTEKSRYEKENKNEKENISTPTVINSPNWKRIKESSSSPEHSPNTIENPFSLQVEKLWENKILPNLLFDIYSGLSSTSSSGNIGVLPSGLSNTILPEHNIPNIDLDNGDKDKKEKIKEEKEKGKGKKNLKSTIENITDNEKVIDVEEGKGEVEGIRISFSLCASTYATTYLEHLTEMMNKK